MIVKDILDRNRNESIIQRMIELHRDINNSEKTFVVYGTILDTLRAKTPLDNKGENDLCVFVTNWIYEGGKPAPEMHAFNTRDIAKFRVSETEFQLYKLGNTISRVMFRIDAFWNLLTRKISWRNPCISKKYFNMKLSYYDFLPENVTSYGIEFSPWNEVLGYHVFGENAREFGDATLLALLLYEITFYGFHENTIQERAEEIRENTRKAEDAIKNGRIIEVNSPGEDIEVDDEDNYVYQHNYEYQETRTPREIFSDSIEAYNSSYFDNLEMMRVLRYCSEEARRTCV